MQNQFDSRLVARYIIYRAMQQNKYMDLSKTHQLLYIFDGMFLCKYNRPILDERPRAWTYGVAYPKVQKMIKESDPRDIGEFEPVFDEFEKAEGILHLTNQILLEFGNHRSKSLTQLLNKDGSPWAQTILKNDKSNSIISEDMTADYFITVFSNVQ